MSEEGLVYTIEENCVGCNNCIRHCPLMEANVAFINSAGENKVRTNSDKCIACGKCIQVCEHNARDYRDDLNVFLNDIKSGKKISILVAPAIRGSIKEYKKIFGFLKSLGVQAIYDVSVGADITTWAYLRYIEQNNEKKFISQPCPAIVNYIKKYKQSILPQLIPVQSPLICAAIYYKDYIGCKEEFAFISPCIAKKSEIDSEETKNYVKYNVTIEKLVNYIKENNIDLNSYVEEDIKEKNAFGFLYSRPGGLKENVQQIYPDFWIRQVEGQQLVYEYLKIYEKRSKLDKQLPSLVDALNCEFGCNVGTGMSKGHLEVDDIDAKFNNEKKLKIYLKRAN